MSNIYALEPHTNAKVILHTTKGDIEFELWGKEAPKATRNFIQLCMEGYYDNTIFHRVIPGFIVQGGDPTGTGHGGESIYEGDFPDEFHSRLRFNRRGLVGMANTGENDNGSQFFITLDRADELTRKHTLFGRVAGDTLFNVMKMAELEVDRDGRPLYPPKIKTTEIVINPFDDIVPRITERERLVAQQREQQKFNETKQKKVKKETKKLNLLSFGEEAEELSPETTKKTKMKSSHDFMEAPKNESPSLPSTSASSTSLKVKDSSSTALPEDISVDDSRKLSDSSPLKDKKTDNNADESTKAKSKKNVEAGLPKKKEESMSAKEKIEQLKNDIRNISRREDDTEDLSREKEKKVSLLQLEREKYQKSGKVVMGGLKGRKRKHDDVDDTFARLMAFQNKLSSVKEAAPLKKNELPPCKLHDIPGCESCNNQVADDNVDDDDPNNWMSHKLIFDKDLKGKDLLQRKETVDDYVVIDPRARDAQAKQDAYEIGRTKKESSRHEQNTVGRSGSVNDAGRNTISGSSRSRHKRDDDDDDRRRGYQSRGDYDRKKSTSQREHRYNRDASRKRSREHDDYHRQR